MKIKYWAHPRTGLSEEDAEILGKTINGLRIKLGKKIERNDLKEASRLKTSPIHKYFEWDNKIAGNKYRDHQASLYLTNIKVFKVNGESNKPVRAFMHVRDIDPETDEITTGYVPVQEALKNKNYRQQVIERWQKRLARIREEIREFEEFADVVEILEKI